MLLEIRTPGSHTVFREISSGNAGGSGAHSVSAGSPVRSGAGSSSDFIRAMVSTARRRASVGMMTP